MHNIFFKRINSNLNISTDNENNNIIKSIKDKETTIDDSIKPIKKNDSSKILTLKLDKEKEKEENIAKKMILRDSIKLKKKLKLRKKMKKVIKRKILKVKIKVRYPLLFSIEKKKKIKKKKLMKEIKKIIKLIKRTIVEILCLKKIKKEFILY